MKRLFLVHGWGGSSIEERYQRLKEELESNGFKVHLLDMPDTENPKMQAWVSYLVKNVKTPDKDTYFVGNSIGCQTILCYLETLPEKTKVGGAVFSAGWFNLKPIILSEGPEVVEMATLWLQTPINFKKILQHCNNFTAIFSDDDPYVPLSDKDIFKKELGAKIIVEKKKGHFPGYDKGKRFCVVAEEILNISNNV